MKYFIYFINVDFMHLLFSRYIRAGVYSNCQNSTNANANLLNFEDHFYKYDLG